MGTSLCNEVKSFDWIAYNVYTYDELTKKLRFWKFFYAHLVVIETWPIRTQNFSELQLSFIREVKFIVNLLLHTHLHTKQIRRHFIFWKTTNHLKNGTLNKTYTWETSILLVWKNSVNSFFGLLVLLLPFSIIARKTFHQSWVFILINWVKKLTLKLYKK